MTHTEDNLSRSSNSSIIDCPTDGLLNDLNQPFHFRTEKGDSQRTSDQKSFNIQICQLLSCQIICHSFWDYEFRQLIKHESNKNDVQQCSRFGLIFGTLTERPLRDGTCFDPPSEFHNVC